MRTRFLGPLSLVFTPALLLAACSENALIAKDEGTSPVEDPVAPDILVDPPAIDFGEVLPGASASATVQISNVGDDTLAVSGLTTGSGTITVTSVNPVVAPGDSVETVLTWTPIDSGVNDVLDVDSNDPDQPRVEVPLTGTIPAGDLRIEPAYHDFGTVDVGESDTVVLTVSNVGVGLRTASGHHGSVVGTTGTCGFGAGPRSCVKRNQAL